MNTIQLLLILILYRKSQGGLAKELSISKSTLNGILNGSRSINGTKLEALNDAYNEYPMPEEVSPESSIKVKIPFSSHPDHNRDCDDIMSKISAILEGTRYEASFRMDEIRSLVTGGASYNGKKVIISDEAFKKAKAKLEEFSRFTTKQSKVSIVYDFWVRHTWEAIKIFEAARDGGFAANTAVLKSSLELVFDLKKAINSYKEDCNQKKLLEFLLITSAAQSAEILYEGGYAEFIPDITNVIADNFGTYSEASFKLLMTASPWKHNQEGMKKQLGLGKFNRNKLSVKGFKLDDRKDEILASIKQLEKSA